MQLIFEKLRWQNFLSTGNQFTEIDLNRSKSTLIIGTNGAGKSTVLDALFYALFGKAFRNINKPQLVNSITQKNLLVEVEFSIGKKKYMVRRGMKPNIFEVYQSDQLINQNSDIREYQEMLEKTILKMSDRSMRQIVVLGSADYRPFMQLPTGDRRLVIEDLLDIQIFSIMNLLLKEKVSQNRMDMQSADYEIEMVEQKIVLNEKHVKSLMTNNDEIIDRKKRMIDKTVADIEEFDKNVRKLSVDVDVLLESISDQNKANSRLDKIVQLENTIESKVKNIKKEIGFFEKHDSCPTCKQDIDAEFKTERLHDREEQLQDTEKALLKLEDEYKKANGRLLEINTTHDRINKLQSDIRDNMGEIRVYQRNITTLEKEIEDIQNNTTQIDLNSTEINKLKKDKKAKIDYKYELIDSKELFDISAALLKDGGIKTHIIRQYIPIINKLVNKYLASMDFFVNFEMDEKFSETIRSRFRDEFTYASFSEGEKMRIDLALMFTWRAIAKLRNSTSTNLLIMDEVFDSSLDGNGTEEFLKILESLTVDTNVFVISHKGAQLHDKFHSLIKFEKHKNFSKMVNDLPSIQQNESI